MAPSVRRPARPRAAAPGFTLLEVLVAVAVLGLVYVTVARIAIQGMQSEGDASRRLEASLLADRALAELETQLAQGTAPPLGEQTREEAGYRLEVAVEPFSAESLGLGGVLAELEPPSRAEDAERRPGEGRVDRDEAPPLALLEPPQRGARPALLQVRVRVAWQDAAHERSVTRTTFALDREVAASRLESVAAADEAAGSGGERGSGAGAREGPREAGRDRSRGSSRNPRVRRERERAPR